MHNYHSRIHILPVLLGVVEFRSVTACEQVSEVKWLIYAMESCADG